MAWLRTQRVKGSTRESKKLPASPQDQLRRLTAFAQSSTFFDLLNGDACKHSNELVGKLEALGLKYRTEGSLLELTDPPSELDVDWVSRQLGPSVCIQYDRVVDSTNRIALESLSPGTACFIAEFQSGGRGRSGRKWISPYGDNLALSVVTVVDRSIADLSGLPLAVGFGMVKALRAQSVEGISLKWPNDLLLNGRKTAGILTEVDPLTSNSTKVVVGAGINIASFPQEDLIGQKATSIGQGSTLSRETVAVIIIRAIEDALKRFVLEGLSSIVEKWQEVDEYADREVSLRVGENLVTGKNVGINHAGHLLVKTHSGLEEFSIGDISLRPSKNENE